MRPVEQKTILVIDDEPDILDIVRMTLEPEGYHVDTACDGLEALESLSRHTPDLILLDIKMPVMDGLAFSREYHSRYDHVAPIVVFTAAADARMRVEETGASGWISKPFDLIRLIEVVDKTTLRSSEE
jgi:CheY-like chemotaxis protein